MSKFDYIVNTKDYKIIEWAFLEKFRKLKGEIDAC
jgi:hypothetical protein